MALWNNQRNEVCRLVIDLQHANINHLLFLVQTQLQVFWFLTSKTRNLKQTKTHLRIDIMYTIYTAIIMFLCNPACCQRSTHDHICCFINQNHGFQMDNEDTGNYSESSKLSMPVLATEDKDSITHPTPPG